MSKALFAITLFYGLSVRAALLPTIWADAPDPAPLRVGDTYYMTTTTMQYCPGIPVMASKDLVDWKIVSYCYDTIEQGDAYSMENGKHDYSHGTWASSMRYDEASGFFYVSCFNAAAKHTYLFRARRAEGPWERFVFNELMYDHSLWIEDGKFRFFASEPKLRRVVMHTLKDDFSGFERETTVVCTNVCNDLPRAGLAEGSQLFRHGEYYYLVNICWPSCRVVNVHRSRQLEGPFDEGRVCFEFEGIAQGSYVQKPDGSWVAVIFGDRGGVGRCPYVLPVEWRDGWPMVQPRDEYAWAKCGGEGRPPSCVTGDDFAAEKLKLEWQWNHNPDPAHWKLAGGRLELTTSRVDANLSAVRNLLTQRTFGPTCEAAVKIDGSALKVGDKAGLALFQYHWSALSLQRTAEGYDLVLDVPTLALDQRWRRTPDRKAGYREAVRRPLGDCPVVYLKATCDFNLLPKPDFRRMPKTANLGQFLYSLDGRRWERLDPLVPLPYTMPHFIGYRFALFAWATCEAGGTAAFDDFAVGCGQPLSP